MRSVALFALLLLLPLSGCIGGSDESGIVVVAVAPRLASAMTLALAVPHTFLGSGEGIAQFWISHDGQVVYPVAGGPGAPIAVEGWRATATIPYADFVVENGQYNVTMEWNGQRSTAQADVSKWVNWMWVFPYVRNNTINAEIVLEDGQGSPSSAIFASGQLHVEVRFRGKDGSANEVRAILNRAASGLQPVERVQIPVDRVNGTGRPNSGEGYYSVEATFHNDQAVGNNNVPMDPTLASANPPTNWVYIGGHACSFPLALPPPIGCPVPGAGVATPNPAPLSEG